jgi:aminodeoxychorismate synthase component I
MLLESARGPMRIARYSFIAMEPYLEYRVKDGHASITGPLADESGILRPGEHPLRTLKRLLAAHPQTPDPALPPFQGGCAGMFSYEFVHYLERIPRTPVDDLGVPDAHIYFYDRVYAFDHQERTLHAIVQPGVRPGHEEALTRLSDAARGLTPAPWELPGGPGGAGIAIDHDTPEERYTEMVRRAKEYIAAGDIFQANLSLRVSADLQGRSPWALYRTLGRINPSPFACYLDMGEYVIAGSSPERLVSVRGRVVETRPIAGTRPRGGDEGEDDAMRRELLLNEKERAEHIMLIDLERNDLGRVCDYGSVNVDEMMITEEYSHVIHIVSNVRGMLAQGKDALDVVRAAFPGGTITGVPKVRCMEIIAELEGRHRGPYTGSIGYVGFGGALDLNIVIRTFTVTGVRDQSGGRAYVQAGAGIVADSDPKREYHESLKKAEALVSALGHLR